MVNQTLARRYALAIAGLAREQNAVERVSADLRSVSEVLSAPGLAHEFFVSPVIDRPAKERALLEILDGKMHPVALHSVLLLVRKRRESLLPAIVAEYLALERAGRGVEPMTLESARPLDRSEFQHLVARLEQVYGKKFEVTEVVDPSLIGGLRIMMGDRRIDDSIAGRLETLARELLQTT
ncbi:MAG: ATP synthase F1 subunit delta [Candidatus Eremiobacteraeota bacterium]|nr:ATP synthase F1 subunit delta [Candidatus Eremiobacteraeota bacterium]